VTRRKEAERAFERKLRIIVLDALEKENVAERIDAIDKVSDALPTASQFIRNKSLECGSNVEIDDGATQITLRGWTGMTFKLLERDHKGCTDTILAKVTTK